MKAPTYLRSRSISQIINPYNLTKQLHYMNTQPTFDIQKRKYILPDVQAIEIDLAISLQLESPQAGEVDDEVMNFGPNGINQNPFNQHLA